MDDTGARFASDTLAPALAIRIIRFMLAPLVSCLLLSSCDAQVATPTLLATPSPTPEGGLVPPEIGLPPTDTVSLLTESNVPIFLILVFVGIVGGTVYLNRKRLV